MKIPLLSRLFEQRSIKKFDQYLDRLVGGRNAKAGVVVDENSSLKSTGVFACVRILSETIASLPLPVYGRLEGGGKKRVREHPLYRVLHDEPNPYMTSFALRETLMGHLLTWGNAYANIVRNGRGQVIELWVLRPDRMQEIKWVNGKLKYYYKLEDGTVTELSNSAVLHISGMGFDGLVGYSPIRMAADAIGLAMATEEYGSRFFSNGAKPGGILKHPGKLKHEARENLNESWSKAHQGLSNQHRVAILEQGMDYVQIGLPPEDSQFLETRKFQLLEVARIYRVPPHMIGDLERSTFSNIEHQSIDFVVHTVRPWLVRWEQAIKNKLFFPRERDKYFAEFVVDGLLRGDTQSRYDAYNKGFQVGAYSVNEILELENRNPIGEAGDQRFIPMHMMPLDKAQEMSVVREPETEQEEDRSMEPAKEERSLIGARNRSIITERFKPMIADALGRIVSGEVADLKRSAKRHLPDKDYAAFRQWLEGYYSKMSQRITRTLIPVVTTFADMMEEAAKQNARGGIEDKTDWITGYVERFAKGYIARSQNQIKQLLLKIESEGLEDPVDIIAERADDWGKDRANKESMYETVNLANAITKAVFVSAGVIKLRWVAIGAETCPYCQEMDGRVVGVEQSFLDKADTLESEDGRMSIYKPAMHPPLHLGCVCQIVPE